MFVNPIIPNHSSFLPLFENKKILEFQKNEILYNQNDICHYVYIILEGRIELNYYDSFGDIHIVNYYGKGSILGMTGSTKKYKHKYTARAVDAETKILKLTLEDALEFRTANDFFDLALQEQRQLEIRKLNQRIEILFYKSVRTRLIKFIENLANDFGQDFLGGRKIQHNLSQTEIAANIGTSRKTASLTLNQLEREGFIELQKDSIYVCLLYTSPSPRDKRQSRMPSSA